jgi:hypothetical protein
MLTLTPIAGEAKTIRWSHVVAAGAFHQLQTPHVDELAIIET